MSATTHVLVTNDDGVAEEGLRHLAAHLRRAGLQVVVAAPERDENGSGTSRAVALDGPVPTRTSSVEGLDDVPVHTVAARPALIVTTACQGASLTLGTSNHWGTALQALDLVLPSVTPPGHTAGRAHRGRDSELNLPAAMPVPAPIPLAAGETL
ncbi:5'/3'-nucleotidase SurE [Kitasatospora sp. NPDC048296]|uniref:5'/3'-nucleotidase SurE n=1 Tax=Kitasatospora sp. NPDC048296 TaxID=3364048 RepID=UPI0037126069